MGEKIAFLSCLRGLGGLALMAAVLSASNCSRPDVIPTDHTEQTQPPDAPFQDQGGQVLSGAAVSPRPSAVSGASTSAQNPPAHYFQNLPAGTLVAVRLKKPVYASTSASESSFEALVVEPVVVGAHTLIPKGAMVAGRVEAARTSNIKPNRGYVRLTLDSVEVGEHRVPLQTASLFAREAPMGDDPISVIHLEKGRRLTFRVAETPIASNQYAQGTH